MKTLFYGGTVVDGTGRPRYDADVLVDNGIITAIGAIEPAADMRTIDAKGLVVAPGFIDTHSHSDLKVLVDWNEKTAC